MVQIWIGCLYIQPICIYIGYIYVYTYSRFRSIVKISTIKERGNKSSRYFWVQNPVIKYLILHQNTDLLKPGPGKMILAYWNQTRWNIRGMEGNQISRVSSYILPHHHTGEWKRTWEIWNFKIKHSYRPSIPIMILRYVISLKWN